MDYVNDRARAEAYLVQHNPRRQYFATTIFTLEKWSQGISSEVCCSIATILAQRVTG